MFQEKVQKAERTAEIEVRAGQINPARNASLIEKSKRHALKLATCANKKLVGKRGW